MAARGGSHGRGGNLEYTTQGGPAQILFSLLRALGKKSKSDQKSFKIEGGVLQSGVKTQAK